VISVSRGDFDVRRHHWVWLAVLLGGAGVVALRVQLQPEKSQPPTQTSPRHTVTLPEAVDYTRHPVVVKDERNRGPMRIISLAPSITESLCALGLQDRLVGRTQYCLHPPEIQNVETVGALMDTNYTRIKRLEPDLVLATGNSTKVVADLKQLDVHCETIPHETLEEVYQAITRLGELCDRPKSAALLNKHLREDMEAQRRAAEAMKIKPVSILITTGPLPVPPQNLWGAGPGSFFDELITRAGHHNAIRRLNQPFAELSVIRILQIDPDVILEFRHEQNTHDREDLYHQWSQIGQLKAIQNRRVYIVGKPEWLSAGPRIAIGFNRLIRALADLPTE